MKSSTSLIKRERQRDVKVSTWSPVEFEAQTPEEADELHRLSEGITEKDVWLGYEIEAANASPSSPGTHGDASFQQGEDVMPEVIKALFTKRSGAKKSAIFKPNEIPVDPYIWPTIEKQPELAEEPEESNTSPEEPAIDLEEIERQAQEILERAQQQAETEAQKIIASGQAQANKNLEEARQAAEGIIQEAKNNEEATTQQAYQNGMHTAHQEAVSLLAAARDVLNAAQAWHEQVLQHSEEDVLALTRSIAQNLFGSGTVIAEDTLKQAFLKAFEDAKSLGNLRLRANPEDIKMIGEDWIDQQAALEGFQIEITPTEGIQRGGCFIEGDFGTLDGRVEKKLEHIFEKIEEVKNTPSDQSDESETEDATKMIGQAVEYVSAEASASPMEIEIAQPVDEPEIIDITPEETPEDQIDLNPETGAA